MKKLLVTSLILVFTIVVNAQDITGQWNGILKVQSMQLRLVFHINKTESGYTTTMDSPDQGANGLPVSSTSFESGILKLEAAALLMTYTGTLSNGLIDGTFTQRGQSIPLQLTRENLKPARPQEPQPPFPYSSEDITFTNDDAKVTLAGTLTLPSSAGQFPVVVLISGSGPQNRDEELLGHKPFLVIADYLTRKGIGVLRYDDRGVGKSTGDFARATTEDHASDAESAVKYLKTRNDVDSRKIGLIGHSDGGISAPMVAARSKDVAFIVMLAGSGLSGHDDLLLQNELTYRAGGMNEEHLNHELQMLRVSMDIVMFNKDMNIIRSTLVDSIKQAIQRHPGIVPQGVKTEAFVNAYVAQLATPWMQFFLKFDPATTLTKVKCPVLALIGEKDLQVPPKENLAAIEKYLKQAKNKNFKTKEMPGLNHLFQECKTGAPSEYAAIEQTFSPMALEELSGWILGVVGAKK